MGQTGGLTAGSMILTMGEALNTYSGQQRQASAVTAQGKYQSAVYSEDAAMAATRAADALSRGKVAGEESDLKTKETIGAERAAIAAGGADVNTGSAAEVQASTKYIGALDKITIENNAQREAYGYQVEESNLSQQGKLAMASASQEAAGLRMQSYGTLLTGAAQTYGLYAETKPKLPRSVGTATGGRTP